MLPLGPEHKDRIALAMNLRSQLYDLLRMVERLVLDRVGVARGPDQRRDGDEVEHLDHRRPRLSAVRGSSASVTRASSNSCAGASVRSPARSFADRARGLRAASASPGAIGPFVTARKLGGAAGAAFGK